MRPLTAEFKVKKKQKKSKKQKEEKIRTK